MEWGSDRRCRNGSFANNDLECVSVVIGWVSFRIDLAIDHAGANEARDGIVHQFWRYGITPIDLLCNHKANLLTRVLLKR